MTRRTDGVPVITCQTSGWTEDARTRTRTWPSPAIGAGTSRTVSSSGDP